MQNSYIITTRPDIFEIRVTFK